jgi:hypothetical protein
MAEVHLDGVGEPVAGGNRTDVPHRFDNEPVDAIYGAAGAISNNETSPKEEFFDGINEPVGVSNRPDFPVHGDNQGKNVTIVNAAAGATGTVLFKETTYVEGRVLNFNP